MSARFKHRNVSYSRCRPRVLRRKSKSCQEVDMPQPRQFKVVSEPPLPTIYTNSSRMMFSVYDFRLMFSEQMVTSDGREFVQVDRVSVVMSPQHLKKLVSTVSAKLAEYEANFGAIPEDENGGNEES